MTCVSVTRPSRGMRPDGAEVAAPSGGGRSLFVNLALLELPLREVLQLADGAGNFRGVRGSKADHVLAVAVQLLQADVADIRDVDFNVRLSFDDHGMSLLAAHASAGRRPELCGGPRRTAYPATTGST